MYIGFDDALFFQEALHFHTLSSKDPDSMKRHAAKNLLKWNFV